LLGLRRRLASERKEGLKDGVTEGGGDDKERLRKPEICSTSRLMLKDT
jgi:hypothetical protein